MLMIWPLGTPATNLSSLSSRLIACSRTSCRMSVTVYDLVDAANREMIPKSMRRRARREIAVAECLLPFGFAGNAHARQRARNVVLPDHALDRGLIARPDGRACRRRSRPAGTRPLQSAVARIGGGTSTARATIAHAGDLRPLAGARRRRAGSRSPRRRAAARSRRRRRDRRSCAPPSGCGDRRAPRATSRAIACASSAAPAASGAQCASTLARRRGARWACPAAPCCRARAARRRARARAARSSRGSSRHRAGRRARAPRRRAPAPRSPRSMRSSSGPETRAR